MKLSSSFLSLIASTSIVYASPAPAGAPAWHPPTQGDSRSPCPGINSLANHGFIPHSGKNITLQQAQDGFARIGLAAPIASSLFGQIGQAGLLGNNGTTLDLTTLGIHNKLEHDGSLSRADASTGDGVSFNETCYKEFLSALPQGADKITIEDMSKARAHRVAIEKARDPDILFTSKQEFSGHMEASVIMAALGGVQGTADLKFLKIVFEQERFPFAEGWTPTSPLLSIAQVQAIIAREIKADPNATVG